MGLNSGEVVVLGVLIGAFGFFCNLLRNLDRKLERDQLLRRGEFVGTRGVTGHGRVLLAGRQGGGCGCQGYALENGSAGRFRGLIGIEKLLIETVPDEASAARVEP